MNRTSKTRSDSSGRPYLKPKLMSWTASWSERTAVASWANSRSRSSRSERSEVSRTMSASLRSGSRMLALLGDGAGDAAVVAERVAVARLAEPADQDVVAGLEEHDARPDAAALERPAHRREGQVRVAGADVEDDGDPREALAIGRDELGEVRAAARRAGCRRRCSRCPRRAWPRRSCRRRTGR